MSRYETLTIRMRILMALIFKRLLHNEGILNVKSLFFIASVTLELLLKVLVNV